MFPTPSRVRQHRGCFLLAVLFWALPDGWSQPNLADATLEQLLQTPVTSVSKKEQTLGNTAAAVFVIHPEDIRRSGAVNIPDLLRMVPGVNVARIEANTWAISIRGFNSLFSNKVLVLIDGRTVYSPLFSNVFWDQVDLPLEDIERIEVIRGPGATVWGANAVNGVINILTRSSRDTQGGLLSAGGGTEQHGVGTIRYGGPLGRAGSYRAFARFTDAGSSSFAGGDAGDGLRRIQGGFRSDWDLSPRDSLMVEGDLFDNTGTRLRSPSFISLPGVTNALFRETILGRGGSLLARWDRVLKNGSQISLQGFYDDYDRRELGVRYQLHTVNFDFQQHLAAGSRHDVVWGLGYRATFSDMPPGQPIAMLPPSRADSLFSAFVQDEIRLSSSVWFTAGSKIEHNPYTGFEYEPSIRVDWAPARRHTLWAAVSRAIRQPSILENAVRMGLATVPLGPSATEVFELQGNPEGKAERFYDLELGYRAEISPRMSFDLSAFSGLYRGLITTGTQPVRPLQSPAGFTLLVPQTFFNDARAHTYGGELSTNWQVTPRWRLLAGYSYLQVHVVNYSAVQGTNPVHGAQLRSLLNVTPNLEFDNSLYYAENAPQGAGRTSRDVRWDTRLGWRLGESLELSVTGQNLLRPQTLEFSDSVSVIATQVERSIFGKITWRF